MADPANSVAQKSSIPTNKTIAATSGSVVGSAIATIVNYAVEQHWGKLPTEVSGAIAVLVTALVTFAAGYFTPHGANERLLTDASGSVVSARMA